MSILIANIGTSDIAVKIGEHFLPIEFNRREPNLEEPNANTVEEDIWRNRQESLNSFFKEELCITQDNPSFREVCKVLLDKCQQEPDIWQSRIAVGRIQGVIYSAFKGNDITQAHLVVTNQIGIGQSGHPTDTVLAFELIEWVLKRQNASLFSGDCPKLCLNKEQITFSAIDEDRLYNYYAELFERIDPTQVVYISVKGGTPQMQQALRAHALAPHTKAQIFISPKLRVHDILSGKPSDCQRVSYWRYQKNQKYQTVQLLLNRWDFDGAAVLLGDWSDTLDAIETDDSALLKEHQDKVNRVIKGLQMAVAHMNLDRQAAEKLQQGDEQLKRLSEKFSTLENLYAQCQIYFELEQISNFLFCLGSFHEATQNRMIELLDGLKYVNDRENGSRRVSSKELAKKAPILLELLENKLDKKLPKNWPLNNRYSRQLYIEGLHEYKLAKLPVSQASSNNSWKKLDFWYDTRNQLVHGAKGINKDRLTAVFIDYLEDYRKQEEKSDEQKALACAPENILLTMRTILNEIRHVDGEATKDGDLQEDVEYGLYRCIRDWAIATLKSPAQSPAI